MPIRSVIALHMLVDVIINNGMPELLLVRWRAD